MKEIICIACGKKRIYDTQKWCNICHCEKKLHESDGSYELHIRSNGRKLQIEDLDDYNPWISVLCDFETKQITLWSLDKVEEIGKQYQASFKDIGLPAPQLDLYIFNNINEIDKIIPLKCFV